MDEKLKKRKHAKKQFSDWGGGEVIRVMTGWLFRYSLLQNAPFRSQIFTIFFASGGKGVLTPLTKILRTPLLCSLQFLIHDLLFLPISTMESGVS